MKGLSFIEDRRKESMHEIATGWEACAPRRVHLVVNAVSKASRIREEYSKTCVWGFLFFSFLHCRGGRERGRQKEEGKTAKEGKIEK